MAQQSNPNGIDVEAIRRFAQSDAGKKLFEALQESHSKQIRQAMQEASDGDYASAQKTVSQMLTNQHLRQMMEQLKGGQHG